MAEYRAVIIGLGFIGGADQVSGDALGQQVSHLDGTHVEALSRHPQVKLVAGSSRDAGRRERFNQRTGVRTYADWQEMLQQEKPDIVSVATYSPVHAEMTCAAAELGARAVYCEKPIATRIDDAERMIAACRKTGTLLVLNHNRRFNPQFRRLQSLVAEGGLGQLTSANLQWGSGRLGNVGTHMIDSLVMLTGQKVAAVSGTLDQAGRPDCRGGEFADPGGWGVLRLEQGTMVTVDAADYAVVPPSVVLNGLEGRATAGSAGVTVVRPDGRREEWTEDNTTQSAPVTSMDRAVTEIVTELEGGAPVPVAAEESLHVLEVIAGFHASHARQAAWVNLPLTGSDRELVVNSG